MADCVRINNEPLLLYDVKNPKAAKGFTDNRYSLDDWSINNQSVALLSPLASASQYLEGKTYPTSNLVMPSIYGCIEHLNPCNLIRQPWDSKILVQPYQLRPEVTAGRTELYDDMEKRWKINLSPALQRFYFIATICDPRMKSLRFPGVWVLVREHVHSHGLRLNMTRCGRQNRQPLPRLVPPPLPRHQCSLKVMEQRFCISCQGLRTSPVQRRR